MAEEGCGDELMTFVLWEGLTKAFTLAAEAAMATIVDVAFIFVVLNRLLIEMSRGVGNAETCKYYGNSEMNDEAFPLCCCDERWWQKTESE